MVLNLSQKAMPLGCKREKIFSEYPDTVLRLARFMSSLPVSPQGSFINVTAIRWAFYGV